MRKWQTCTAHGARVDLLYVSPSGLRWHAVEDLPGLQVSHALRSHARRMWRHREARGTSTTAPAAARAARRAQAGASWQSSTAAPEALHRSGTTPRAGTPRWPHTGGETTPALHPASGCDA